MLGSAESQVPKLISREIIFEEFQRMRSQSTNVTGVRASGNFSGHPREGRIERSSLR